MSKGRQVQTLSEEWYVHDLEVGKTKMDESGVEPETFRMLSERATNYATRPFFFWEEDARR